jgi:hypothetical protein
VHNTVQFVGGNDLGVQVNDGCLLAISFLRLGKSLPGARLTSSGGAHREHTMTNNEQLGKLNDLQDESFIGEKALISNSFLNHTFKVHVTGTRNINAGEKISQQTEENIVILSDNLGDVEITKSTQENT